MSSVSWSFLYLKNLPPPRSTLFPTTSPFRPSSLLNRLSHFFQGDPHPHPAALSGDACSRMIDQHAPHHTGRDAVKVGAILPTYTCLIHQPQIGFMNESSRLQSARRAFTRHALPRQSPQFVIDERHQARRCLLVALAPLVQDTCDFVLRRLAHKGCFPLAPILRRSTQFFYNILLVAVTFHRAIPRYQQR